MKLFNKQSLTLLKDKKLMIAIIAVIFIPILYAGMFLWAFWDPYAHLEDIPVAIVNEDTPYEFEGETFELGNELVNKLREEDEFDFHFVERRDGYKGLQNEDYYILIEIPEDFSKNATTLMDDHPDQLVIRYVPNESYNFLASQIGETAMLQIEMALEQKITETYAETIFEKVDEIKNGLTEANDATEELANGGNELGEGADEIKEHLLVLANKSIEFTNGTNKLKNGAKQLTDGTNELAAGIQQLDDANNELFRGAKRIQDGNIRLRDGIQTANDGAKEINERLPYLVNGTDILSTSLKQFENELPKQMAKQINQTMSNGSSNFKKGLTHLEEGIINGLGTSSESEGLAPQLTNGLIKGINNELNEMNFNLQQLPNQIADRLAKQVATEIVDNQRNQVNDIVNAMKEAGLSEEQINIIVDRFTSNFVNEEQFEKLLKQQIKDELENDFNELDHYITNKQNDIGTTISSAVYDAIEQTEVKISDGFLQFSNEVSNNLDTVSGNIEHMITKSVKPTFKQLEQGVNTINNGQKQLQIGMNELANGVNELKRGSSTIVDGQDELMNNMDLFTNKFSTANSGINELYYSSKRLLDGVIQIDDGAKLLSDGSRELANI